jgi:hypothetical protein
MVTILAALFVVLTAAAIVVASRRPRVILLTGIVVTSFGGLAVFSVATPQPYFFAPPINPWITLWLGMVAILLGTACLAGGVIRWSLNRLTFPRA